MSKAFALFAALLPFAAFGQFKIEPFDQPKPSSSEQSELVEKVRRKAIEYTKSLPNFLCTQQTRRSAAKPTKANEEPAWKLVDALTIKLSFFDQEEKYKLAMINGKPAKKTMEQLTGGKWKGDFGSAMRSVFDPKSMAFFSWDHWGKVNGRVVAVLIYGIDVKHAAFGTTFSQYGRSRHINWGCEGQVVIDVQTLEVLRLTVDSVDLPADSPVGEVHLVLDYVRQKVGDQEFLLPARSVSWSLTPNGRPQKSESLFTDYQKFSAESGIKFN